MKTLDQLKQMRVLVQAAYDREQISFQRVVAQENALRSELARVGALDSAARATMSQDTAQRALGADVIWQGWVGRAKTQLNMKLARVLATKEHHLAQVRRAYGKVLVVEDLIKQAKVEEVKQAQKRSLDQAVETALFSAQ